MNNQEEIKRLKAQLKELESQVDKEQEEQEIKNQLLKLICGVSVGDVLMLINYNDLRVEVVGCEFPELYFRNKNWGTSIKARTLSYYDEEEKNSIGYFIIHKEMHGTYWKNCSKIKSE